MTLYLFTLLVSQIFPLLLFFLEYFHMQVGEIGQKLFQEWQFCFRFSMQWCEIKFLTILKLMIVFLWLTEGFISLWAIQSKIHPLHGYHFGRILKNIHTVILAPFSLESDPKISESPIWPHFNWNG